MANTSREFGPEIIQDGDFAEARWKTLSRFGLDRPSGDLKRDLEDNKKVLLQRGLNVREIRSMPDMGKGVVQFIASTDGVKRDGNEVVNTGWNFHGFEQNPAFLWSHDYRSLPIGKHVKWSIDVEDGGSVLRVWSQFVEAEDYPFAGRVQTMYEKGFLRAVSIGWNPIEWEFRVDDEGEIQGYRFTKNDLLEVSAVSVPSDPDAIVEAINKRVLSSEDVELMARSGALPKLSRKIAYTLSNFEPLETEERTEEDTEVKETETTDVEVTVDGEAVADAVRNEAMEKPQENVEERSEAEPCEKGHEGCEDCENCEECKEREEPAEGARAEEVVNPVEEEDDDDETEDPTLPHRSTYKGETVNTTPNDAMAKEAIKGLEWRSEYGRGGTEVGVARARDIKNKKELSPSTIRRMYSFFSRHEVDKKAEGFRPGEDGYPSNGRIAWALWGGDPGYSFAKRVVKTLDNIDERMVDDDLETQDQTMPLREAVQAASTRFADELVDVIGKVLGRDFGIDYVDEVPSETADEIINKAEDAQEINKDTKREYEVEEEEISKVVARFHELNEAIDVAEGRLGSRLSKKTRTVLDDVAGSLEKAQAGIRSLIEEAVEAVEEVEETASAEETAETRGVDRVGEPVEAQVVEEEEVAALEPFSAEVFAEAVAVDFGELERKLSGLSRELGVPDEGDVLERLTKVAEDMATVTRSVEEPEVKEEPKSEYVSDLFDKLDILSKEF